MQREVIPTKDGSHTVSIPSMGVTYHSMHGAIQESMHVFIQAGLDFAVPRFADTELKVFEMGFGTGLNAFLTAIEAMRKRKRVYYAAIELEPITDEQSGILNYPASLGNEEIFRALHSASWNAEVRVHDHFTLHKQRADLLELQPGNSFHLIYYDAFAPSAQPELWTEGIFRKLHRMLLPGGLLVTYCSKGDVRRAMSAAGFDVTKIPGPPGKREMVRSFKAYT